MKKLYSASLLVLALSVALWTAGRTLFPLPDWAVRANGVVQMIAMSLLAFSAVRQKVKNP
ncbi:MAG: hypothetical protein HFF29_01945 [Oscillospiraceae bacterium]|nr:hypothetical protein [Oscillospiraceae bacterium]MCI8762672.1 hypothetical protein [Oscillospiraceae bacterium]